MRSFDWWRKQCGQLSPLKITGVVENNKRRELSTSRSLDTEGKSKIILFSKTKKKKGKSIVAVDNLV